MAWYSALCDEKPFEMAPLVPRPLTLSQIILVNAPSTSDSIFLKINELYLIHLGTISSFACVHDAFG